MESNSKKVLETYEKRIIDLSRRNRLLKYPKSARSIDFSMSLEEFQDHFGVIPEMEISFVHKDILSTEQDELKDLLLKSEQFESVINSIYNLLLQFGIQIDLEELRTTTGISRIDYCKNVLIQSSAKSFANLMHKFQKARSHTYDEYKTSVLFANKQQGLTVYDKVSEVTKVLRNKNYNNRASKEYQVAKILNEHRKVHGLEVIRVEHRLLNRQTIKRELSPFIDSPYPFTLKEIFNTRVCSQLLLKHWSKTISEEKLKLLLIGDQNMSSLFDTVVTAAKKASIKFNPLSALYIKLLSEVGEKEADIRILKVKSSGSLNNYKKKLHAMAQEVFFMILGLKIIGALRNHYRNFLSSLFQLSQLNFMLINGEEIKII